MFTLTQAAARQVLQAATESGAGQMVLRIAARQDSDGSLHYGMGFDESSEDDLKLLIEGVAIVIGPESQELLDETTLDFVELDPGAFNFIFVDGRASEQSSSSPSECGSCGAGSCSTGGGCH